MAFGLGSQIALPLINKSGNPLNGFEVAQNKAEVLAYDPSIRYVGMSVYCIDEGCVLRFKNGVSDNDFVVDSSASTPLQIASDYSTLPTSTIEQIAYCKDDYVDTTVTPNVTYKKGFYLYDLVNGWEIIQEDIEDEYQEWDTSIEYHVGDKVEVSGSKYECIVDHTSTTFTLDEDKWVKCIEEYYVLTQAKHDSMVASGLITDDTEKLYVIMDANSSEVEVIFDNYSLLPTGLSKEMIAYCKEDYTDVATGDTYINGFYLYSVDNDSWSIIGENTNTSLVEEWTNDTAYVSGNIRLYNGIKYECIIDHTSNSAGTLEDDVANWIRVIEKVRMLTQTQLEYLETNGLVDKNVFYSINDNLVNTVTKIVLSEDNIADGNDVSSDIEDILGQI